MSKLTLVAVALAPALAGQSHSAAILFSDGTPWSNVASVIEVLDAARDPQGAPALDVVTVGRSTAPLACGPVTCVPAQTLARTERCDILVLPAHVAVDDDLRRVARAASWVLTVGAGALTAVDLGLRDDRSVTAEPGPPDDLSTRASSARAERNRAFTSADGLICARDGGSAFDASLHLLDRALGSDIAVRTAAALGLGWLPGSRDRGRGAGSRQRWVADDADRTAILRTASTYVDVFYRGVDPEPHIHPNLDKQGVRPDHQLRPMSFDQMSRAAARAQPRRHAKSPKELEILDQLELMASVRVHASWGYDYLNLAKLDGQWKVVQVLWQADPFPAEQPRRQGSSYVCPPCHCGSCGVVFGEPGTCPDCGMKLLLADKFKNWKPTPSPDGSSILFLSDRSGDDELFVMDVDGSDHRRVCELPGKPRHASWSPDAKQIVAACDLDGVSALFLIDANSGSARRLFDDDVERARPVWSPAGDRIAFVEGVWPATDVVVSTLDGQERINLTRANRGPDLAPAWSPDGRHLAYAGGAAGEQAGMLWIIGADGTDRRRLREGWNPAWAPDGERIAFRGQLGIGVVGISGGEVEWLANGRNPAWAPDSSQLYFHVDRDEVVEVHVVGLDGETRQLTDQRDRHR